MRATTSTPHAPLSSHRANQIQIRGTDVGELVGAFSFSEMLLFSRQSQAPSVEQRKIVDAVLIVALESVFTPSAAADRVPYKNSTDSLTAGVATGLLAAGGGLFAQAEAVARLA